MQKEYEHWLERKKLDRECSVLQEIARLKEAGFKSAECIYLNGKFTVIMAQLFAGRTGFPYLVVIGSVFSAVWDMQYVILQRYNRPKIARLMKDLKLSQM